MPKTRIIRKYPNRRLYDTHESRYVALPDVRRLVEDGIEFVVLDRQSGEDVTRCVLLQLIAEQEHDGDPMMSQEFLTQVIRANGSAVREMVGSYLEYSLERLMGSQLTKVARRPAEHNLAQMQK